MVAKIWRGWTKPENADKYEALLNAEIFPEIAGKDIPGYRAIQLFREPAGGGKSEVEFITIMWFDSWEAVGRFDGEDYERAYVPPRARAVPQRFDERSRHYGVRERLEY
jgi:hypothetical protein